MEGEDNLGMDMFGDLDFSGLDPINNEGDDGNPPLDVPIEGLDPIEDPVEEPGEGTEDPTEINDINDSPSEDPVEDPEIVAKENAKDEDAPDTDSGTTSPTLYKSLVSVLQEEGVLTEVEDDADIKDVTQVIDLIKGEIKRQEFADLNDLQKEAIEAYRAGIPVERFNKQKEVENNLENITEEDLASDEKLRQQLIYQEFRSKDYTHEKALKLMQRSFQADEDVDDAKAALAALKANVKERFQAEIEANKKAEADAAKAQQERQKRVKDRIFKTDEIVKGYKITEGVKKKIYSEIYNPTSTNPDTGSKENTLMKYQRENPDEFMHKLYYLFTVTKGFSDFSYFANKERSSSVKDLEAALKMSSHVRGGGDPSFLDDPDSKDINIIGDQLLID